MCHLIHTKVNFSSSSCLLHGRANKNNFIIFTVRQVLKCKANTIELKIWKCFLASLLTCHSFAHLTAPNYHGSFIKSVVPPFSMLMSHGTRDLMSCKFAPLILLKYESFNIFVLQTSILSGARVSINFINLLTTIFSFLYTGSQCPTGSENKREMIEMKTKC